MTILITGSSGKYGKDVINFLLEKKVNPKNIVALVRDPSKGEEYKKKGVEIRVGDYDNYQSLVDAFKNVDQLLFISSNDPVNKLKQQQDVVKAAKEASVKNILYTSFIRKTEDGSSPVHNVVTSVHIQTEDLIKKSGIPYTLLVNGLYSDVLTEFFFGPSVLSQGIFFPASQGKSNYTTRRDQAEATANILLNPSNHLNKTYVLANNESYTLTDASKILSEISGKLVPYTSPEVETYREILGKVIPSPLVEFSIAFALAIKQNEFETDKTDLPTLLGRKPTTLKDFLTTVYKSN
ncbi:hypothetical protein DLAC_00474 [Tieghemostelium lacteum]|uniref:NmrA-like domain-containing protein n=1 Tax=Tieghemostelium lacteum TaxID=361077 RepID=A0A152A9U1_TIELA|nr:hypothetical protein DLAC_00474 [Tieghemostelium lacteum]|eukprot:KYR02988.1 hypothetical protein DLAC_00474 [Tieghemostelium lacteum]